MRKTKIAFAVLAMAIVGCSSARIVSVMPGEGGEIAIAPRESAEARQKGEVLMRDNCRSKKIKVVEESEVVTGQETKINVESNRNKYGYNTGGITQQATKSTTNNTEWRIKYKCE